MTEIPQRLYHYTSLSSFSKIWMSGHLLFSNSIGTNDIFESRKITSFGSCKPPVYKEKSELKALGHLNDLLREELAKYKQISLTQDYSDDFLGYSSPMMWGQYAEKVKGVCIELDLRDILEHNTKCLKSKIDYTDNVPIIDIDGGIDLSTKEYISKYIEENIYDIFFKKHNHWSYENEYRIVSNKLDYIEIKEAVKKVFVPYNEGDVEFKIVEKLLDGSNVDIQILIPTGSPNARKISSFSWNKMKESINNWTKHK